MPLNEIFSTLNADVLNAIVEAFEGDEACAELYLRSKGWAADGIKSKPRSRRASFSNVFKRSVSKIKLQAAAGYGHGGSRIIA